jgi:hypothetical protein
VVTLLTDYGLDDGFAGVCHGVIAGICPQARIIDLTHGIPRQDVLAGALVLAGAIRYMPAGVHVAVVDPGVGSARRAIAVASGDGRRFVGPDNGLLWLALHACGGIVEAVEISASPLRLAPVSATFHGRDIFAPAAAHLAAGVPLSAAGSPLDAGELVALEPPRARVADGILLAPVVYVDGFGNVQLGATNDEIEALGLEPGRSRVELALSVAAALDDAARAHSVTAVSATARYVRTFDDARADELIVYLDSAAALAVAVNRGSAAYRLGLKPTDVVRISKHPC